MQLLAGTFVSHYLICKGFDFDRSINTSILSNHNSFTGYTMAISVPAEISAAATVIQFWNASINSAVWISVFLVLLVVLNLCGVRMYGEVR